MKKIIAIVLVLVMGLSLCACGKSEATKAAEEAISAIGEVSLNSESAIKNAEKLYGILTDKEKESVENRLELVNAREKYDTLVTAAEEEARLAAAEAEKAATAAALVEAEKVILAFDMVEFRLDFVYKYAGNRSNSGSLKFDDTFVNEMYSSFSDIDLDIIRPVMPEFADAVFEIVENNDEVADLLVDMGGRESTSKLSNIKSLSNKTLELIDDAINIYNSFVNSLD